MTGLGEIDYTNNISVALSFNPPAEVATSYSISPSSTNVDEAAGTVSFTVSRSGGFLMKQLTSARQWIAGRRTMETTPACSTSR
jgi:hypothetical protein